MRDALEERMVSQTTGFGTRALELILRRMLKGELAMRLQLWRLFVKGEAHAAQMVAVEKAIANAVAGGKKAALRQMQRAIQTSPHQGSSPDPRPTLPLSLVAILGRQAAMRALVYAEAQQSGTRLLRRVLQRVLKGELGERIDDWHVAVVEHKAEVAKRTEVREAMARQAEGLGMQRLRAVVRRRVKGVLAERVEGWRAQMLEVSTERARPPSLTPTLTGGAPNRRGCQAAAAGDFRRSCFPVGAGG